MEDCLFCKIISGEIPSKKIYEDELTYVFEDIAPTAPIHYLVIPKQHISKLDEITPENSAVIAHIYEVIAKLAKDLDLKDGFRVVSNCALSFKGDGGSGEKKLLYRLFVFCRTFSLYHWLGQEQRSFRTCVSVCSHYSLCAF